MKKTRRDFIKKGTLALAGSLAASPLVLNASSYNAILGSNDRVNVCFMGLGRRVPGYYPILGKEYNTKLVNICDVKRSQIDKSLAILKNKIDYVPKQSDDIRKVLEDKNLDAVFMATPDHWHAPGAIMALDAGKHVYLEKPCAHNPYEAEILVKKAAHTKKMVQMGNQQRSSNHTREIIKEIHEGLIGETYRATAFFSNSRGEVPTQIKQAPPADLNWDLFQGPAPRQDYYHDIWNYNWHWYGWKWGTAEMGNNAIHELDVARWALKVDYPSHVKVSADKEHFKNDGWEMYDTMMASFSFGDKEIVWDGKSRNGYTTYGAGRGTIIYGTKGTVFVNRSLYRVFDRENKLIRESDISNESGLALGGGGSASNAHAKNFLEGIRGKEELRAPIHDGAISNHLALLGNISYRINKPFDVDIKTGKAYDRDAMKLWKRTYEPGWEPK